MPFPPSLFALSLLFCDISLPLLYNRATHRVGIQRIGNGVAELSAEVVGIKFLNVHHRSEVFSGEPPTAFAAVDETVAQVARIAARRIRASAVVHENAVSVERLGERDLRKLAVGSHAHRHRGAVQRSRVNHAEQ